MNFTEPDSVTRCPWARHDYDGEQWVGGDVASLAEVTVLRDDDQVVLEGVGPYGVVVRSCEPDIAHVHAVREHFGEAANQPMRQVLIEQEPHP